MKKKLCTSYMSFWANLWPPSRVYIGPQCRAESARGLRSASPGLCGTAPVPLLPPVFCSPAGPSGGAPTRPSGWEPWTGPSGPPLAPSAPPPASRPPPGAYSRRYCRQSSLPAAESGKHTQRSTMNKWRWTDECWVMEEITQIRCAALHLIQHV